MKYIGEYTVANAIAPRAITSSTNASPIVVTATAHGYSTGDIVTIFGHATNTAANGTWTVTKVTADTFSLDGSTGNGVGADSGVRSIAPLRIFVRDADHVKLTFDTDGGGDAAMTVKIAGSHGDAYADYAASQAVTNQYDFIDVVDNEDAASVDGDTGFVVASADDHRMFSVNTEALDWLSLQVSAGTAGELTVKAALYSIN